MSNFFSALDDDSGDEADNNPKVVARGKVNNREEHTKPHPKKSSGEATKKSNANKQGGGGKQGGNTKGGRGPRPTRDGKRTFDRKSGTGRGKEIKKGGGGAHNWGNDKNLARRNQGTVVEGQEDAGDEEAEAQELADEPRVEVVEEEEDKTLSYEEYMQTKSRPDNANFAPPKEREVVNEFANVKAAVAVEEDFLVMGGTKGQKKKGIKAVEEKKTIDVGFRVADSNSQDNRRSNNRGGRDGDRRNSGGRGRGGYDRRGGGGRGRSGGGRGRGGSGRGRGGGGGKGSGLNVADSSAFPSL